MANQAPEATIISFPKNKIIRLVPEESREKLKIENLKSEIDNLIPEIAQDLIAELHLVFELDEKNPNLNKDYSYMMEVLRAMLYRNIGVDHPFHKYLDDMVELVEGPISAEEVEYTETKE